MTDTASISDLIQGAANVVRQEGLRAVLLETVETAMSLTGARYGALGVIGEHGVLADFYHVGLAPGTAKRIGPLPTGRGVLGTLIQKSQTVRLKRIQDHVDSFGFPEHHPEMESFLGVPVRLADQVYGNLYLTEKPGGFTEEDEHIVESLAIIAGSAVSSARLNARMHKVAVVEDRERIARDLHDAIIQDLFAVGLSLQGLGMRVRDDPTREALEDAVQRLDEAISSLRQFIFGLRPPLWADRSLHTELGEMLDQLSAPHSAALQLELSDVGSLEGDLIDQLVQIVRELGSNALRHAHATELLVSLDRFGDDICIGVTDNGIGFDPATVERGMGLDNLQARAIQIDASIDIVSEAGRGTEVTIRFHG